jgi:1,4-dihydroxy-2-naphthoate octaprenyltransferase
MARPGTAATLIATTRPAFLLLAPACMLVGIGTAMRTGDPVSGVHILLALIGGIAAHAAVNALNEYFDFRSGLDATTRRTPFSGGSGALPARPDLATATLMLAGASLALACAVGLYFMVERGAALLPVGLLGVIVVLAYTPWATRHPIACLLAPGIGFGPAMVVGTHIALTGTHATAPWIASVVPFFLVNALLLLNQFPDVEADRGVGRRHLPMLLGRPRAARLYAALVGAAFAWLAIAVITGLLPRGCAAGLLAAPLGYSAARRALRDADDLPALVPAMALNVALNLATPVLMGLGLLLDQGPVAVTGSPPY